MNIKMMSGILSAALFIQLVLLPDFLYAQADFYRGKTITIIHGRSAGGSGDLRARAVTPFLTKYIPGNPNIVHEYMDGAGGRKAANHIFSSARPDGLTIGSVGGAVVESAVLGEIGVQYDLDKLHFVGSPYSRTHYVLLTRREAGFRTLDKLQQASGVRLGSQAVGHTNYTVVDQNVMRASILEDGLREAGYHNVTVLREMHNLMRRIVEIDPEVIVIDLENPNRDVLEQMFQVSRVVRGRSRCSSTAPTPT